MILTTMPWTRQSTFWREDAVLQGRTIMCTIGVQRRDLIADFDKQDFSTFDALHFDLDFVQFLEVELGQILEFPLLSHLWCMRREQPSGKVG